MDKYFKYISFLVLKRFLPRELITDIISTIDIAHFADIIKDAKMCGWTYDIKYNIIFPPSNFSCSRWSACYRKAYDGEKEILVPHWIDDNNVRRTGKW